MANKNGNPQNFKTSGKLLAARPLTVRLEVSADEFVRSLPNCAEWVREAIAEKLEREQNNNCV